MLKILPNAAKAISFIVFSFAFSNVYAVPNFVVTDLGQVNYIDQSYWTSQSQVVRINTNGLVAGSVAEAGSSRAAVWNSTLSSYTKISSLESAVSAINNNDQLVGWEKEGAVHLPTLWSKDSTGAWKATRMALMAGFPDAEPWGINDNGVIVGSVRDASGQNTYAVYWSSVSSNPQFVGGGAGFKGAAYAVNNSGRIVGFDETKKQSFSWDGGSSAVVLIPEIESTSNTWGGAYAVNNKGQVAGASHVYVSSGYTPWSVSHPFTWTPETGTQDSNPPDISNTYSLFDSWAESINEAGYLVGSSIPTAVYQEKYNWSAFTYRLEPQPDGSSIQKAFNLNSLVSEADKAKWKFSRATDIDEVGRIVGLGYILNTVSGNYDLYHAYMLTPQVADLVITQSTPITTQSLSKAYARVLSSAQTPAKLILAVKNLGPLPAENVLVADTLAEGLLFQDATSTDSGVNCAQDTATTTNAVNCVIPTLAVGQTTTINLAFAGTAVGEFDFTAQVSSAQSDELVPENNATSGKVQITVDSLASSAQDTSPPPTDPSGGLSGGGSGGLNGGSGGSNNQNGNTNTQNDQNLGNSNPYYPGEDTSGSTSSGTTQSSPPKKAAPAEPAGGGCSLALNSDGVDPTLPMLALLASVFLFWQRRLVLLGAKSH